MSAETTGEATDASRPEQTLVPALRVVSGQPTEEELAALVVVLASRTGAAAGAGAGADEAETSRDVSAWTDRSRYVRSGRVGFGTRAGWRASALPR